MKTEYVFQGGSITGKTPPRYGGIDSSNLSHPVVEIYQQYRLYAGTNLVLEEVLDTIAFKVAEQKYSLEPPRVQV